MKKLDYGQLFNIFKEKYVFLDEKNPTFIDFPLMNEINGKKVYGVERITFPTGVERGFFLSYINNNYLHIRNSDFMPVLYMVNDFSDLYKILVEFGVLEE